jgi:hypothetical protein
MAKQARRKNPAAVALGKRRAKLGYEKTVKARWEGVPVEERQALARKAAAARWGHGRSPKSPK